jgi:hypothetical protein
MVEKGRAMQRPSGITALATLYFVSGTLKLVTHVVAANRRAITPAGVVGALVNGATLVYLSMPHVQRALWDDRDDARPDDEAVTA